MASYHTQLPEHMQQQQHQEHHQHNRQPSQEVPFQHQHSQNHHHQHQQQQQPNMQSVHTHRRPPAAHSTAPYSIPQKINNGNGSHQAFSSSPHTGGPIHGQKGYSTSVNQAGVPPMQGEYSASLPLLSRDFVVRRISEGETGRLKEELKCEACGKGYKHISSLAKHLWEHTPEWNVTKKLLISKHQQVQLLEAASILCSMTEPPLTPRTSPSRHPNDSPVEFDNVDPSTSSSSNSPSPFEGINSQSQYTPSSTNTSATSGNGYNNVDSNIKFRHNSISQYPPSTTVALPQRQHKMKTDGGYIDISDPMNADLGRRKNSITNLEFNKNRDDDGLLKETVTSSYNGGTYLSSVPEHESSQAKSFKNSYHHKNSVSTLNSERTLKNTAHNNGEVDDNDEEDEDDEDRIISERDEDDGVFGAMD